MSKNSKKKWTPTPEQLEKYKKQVEETKELSKTAIRDIFDNYTFYFHHDSITIHLEIPQ